MRVLPGSPFQVLRRVDLDLMSVNYPLVRQQTSPRDLLQRLIFYKGRSAIAMNENDPERETRQVSRKAWMIGWESEASGMHWKRASPLYKPRALREPLALRTPC